MVSFKKVLIYDDKKRKKKQHDKKVQKINNTKQKNSNGLKTRGISLIQAEDDKLILIAGDSYAVKEAYKICPTMTTITSTIITSTSTIATTTTSTTWNVSASDLLVTSKPSFK